MTSRPVFFLKSLDVIDKAAIALMEQLGWPVLVEAERLQASAQSDLLLSLLAPNQLQILSVEVEAEASEWSLIFDNATEKGWTHLIVLTHPTTLVLEKISSERERLFSSPETAVFFTSENKQVSKVPSFFKTLMDLGDEDFRKLATTNAIYPVTLVKKVNLRKKEKLWFYPLLYCILKSRRGHSVVTIDMTFQGTDYGRLERWRASLHNWWLLALSSLHKEHAPAHSSLSFAVGAFVACTPFYGLQTLLLVTACFILRLSFPIAFLGSQISLPPFYALIVPLQLYVGAQITGRDLSFEGPVLAVAQSHFQVWAIGALIVGTVIALVMGLSWYWVQKRMQRDT